MTNAVIFPDLDIESRSGNKGTIAVEINGTVVTFLVEGCNGLSCPPEPIPTMSEWGLMIFGLLVLNLGVIFLRRREEIFTA